MIIWYEEKKSGIFKLLIVLAILETVRTGMNWPLEQDKNFEIIIGMI